MNLLKLIFCFSFIFDMAYSKSADLTVGAVKRCFYSKVVRYRCSYEQDLQTKEWDSELEIKVLGKDGVTHYYGYGKMIGPDVCKEHYLQIKKLISHTRRSCIYSEIENQIGPKETFAKWRGLKTIKGSYFW